MRYRLKLSFMSVVVLHEDPPATPGDRLDVGQTSAEKLKSLSEAYYGRVEGIVTSGMAVELSDLRRQFSQACRHDHIRWEPHFFIFYLFIFYFFIFYLFNFLFLFSFCTVQRFNLYFRSYVLYKNLYIIIVRHNRSLFIVFIPPSLSLTTVKWTI